MGDDRLLRRAEVWRVWVVRASSGARGDGHGCTVDVLTGLRRPCLHKKKGPIALDVEASRDRG